MGFWDNLKRDIKKGIDEGLHALKEGTGLLKDKAEDMSTEMKKKVKAFELKQKIQIQLTELGGKVYDLVGKDSRRNPLRDEKVKKTIERIKKLHDQLDRIEGKSTKKKTRKATSKRRPSTRRRTTKKKITEGGINEGA